MYAAAGRNRANVSIVVRVGGSFGPPDFRQICGPPALCRTQVRRDRWGKSSGSSIGHGGNAVVLRCPRRVAKRQHREIYKNPCCGKEAEIDAAKWPYIRRNRASWA